MSVLPGMIVQGRKTPNLSQVPREEDQNTESLYVRHTRSLIGDLSMICDIIVSMKMQYFCIIPGMIRDHRIWILFFSKRCFLKTKRDTISRVVQQSSVDSSRRNTKRLVVGDRGGINTNTTRSLHFR